MSHTEYPVGAILQNSLNQYTKIISVRRGIYGISGWTNRANAEKATVAHKFVNVYGLKYANARVVTAGKSKVASATDTKDGDSTTDTPTKASIAKLSADEAKALHKKVVGSEVETGKAAKDGLVAFYKL